MLQRQGVLATAMAAGLLPRVARSQAFPSWQLRFLVEAAPSGNIATRELLRAPTDGHTILLASVGGLAVNPFVMKEVGYAPQDFAPIMLAVDFSKVIVAHPSVPAQSLAEYLTLARQGPDGMTPSSRW